MQIYQSPGGPVVGPLRPGQHIQVLYREITLYGLVWVEIQDDEGRTGWVPLYYLRYLTPTPIPSATPTHTIVPSLNAAVIASPTQEK